MCHTYNPFYVSGNLTFCYYFLHMQTNSGRETKSENIFQNPGEGRTNVDNSQIYPERESYILLFISDAKRL